MLSREKSRKGESFGVTGEFVILTVALHPCIRLTRPLDTSQMQMLHWFQKCTNRDSNDSKVHEHLHSREVS